MASGKKRAIARAADARAAYDLSCSGSYACYGTAFHFADATDGGRPLLAQPPALLTEHLSLTPPGAETARLEGHSGSVTALCVLPDGRLASGSWDHTIRLWDIAAGHEITRLEVDAPVHCLAVLPDARLVAGDQLGRLHWLEIVD